ncbi:ABC transporter permease DevC [Chroococcus sp. FPU101]|uniref:ABC transporter permease DevC n=1 Tax=Chroococcus sp. FPU101 TaxID=1974212 RepID=UPI001A8C221A|nr:ABC transporter permease DevC [Chroococcus sp. FPU101]GFE70701.1 ABC-transporter DevC family protein [Chroococcus sp. FPU101]
MLPKFLRKTPLAWLQVSREKSRLAIALAGIAFADLLMFTQMGFKDALFNASVKPHYILNTDLVLANPQFETMFAVKSFSRERLYQAMRVDGIESTSSLYIGSGPWRNPETNVDRPILIFGTDPTQSIFKVPEINQHLNQLKMLNTVVFDQAGRTEFGPIAELLKKNKTVSIQLNQKEVQVVGVFSLGASFAADGNVVTSDSTFLNLFPERQPDQIDLGLIKVKSNADLETVKANLQQLLPKNEVSVFTLDEFAKREIDYWANSTAIGFIFTLGTVVGFIVGIVIVYQILYSDVSDHLPEYATLKAMGYGDGYLIKVLMQEALILAFLGFIPGFVASIGLYNLAASATLLPIIMSSERAITVLALTIIMCGGSGVVAMRKLRTADPSDIF